MSASTQKFNPERLMTLILGPVISEKSTFVADKLNQVIFRVVSDATKPEVKAAVELMFNVKVDSVTLLNVHGKQKRVGRVVGRRRGWKKAYVSLEQGQEINFAVGA
ncbi:MAG: 50S ribosomal protein L23 [Burkholderiales bacterium]|jgi:large subunit ribosomal protein L23|nr:50S ribosomal protein L23 [Burkholderiales bacterium]